MAGLTFQNVNIQMNYDIGDETRQFLGVKTHERVNTKDMKLWAGVHLNK